MVREDRLARGDSRKNRFASAGIAGEEVRLDEALRDEEIGLHGQPVEAEATAGRQDADIGHGGVVCADVQGDFLMRDNVLAKLFGEFVARRRAMAASRHQERDVD